MGFVARICWYDFERDRRGSSPMASSATCVNWFLGPQVIAITVELEWVDLGPQPVDCHVVQQPGLVNIDC